MLKLAPKATVFVTEDSASVLPTYNCLGFALGIRHNLKVPVGTVPAVFLKQIGLRRREPLAPSEKGIAKFGQHDITKWHVAKHLRDGWFESKCASSLRIVHRLDCFTDDSYGPFENYWEFDGSEIATHKLKVALWEDEDEETGRWGRSLDTIERVDDSARLLETFLLIMDLMNSNSPTHETAVRGPSSQAKSRRGLKRT